MKDEKPHHTHITPNAYTEMAHGVRLSPGLRSLPARMHRATLVCFMLNRRHEDVCLVGALVLSVLRP